MSERTAYNRFKLMVMLPGDRLDRIENMAGTGMPDVNGCFEGSEFWIEIKNPRKEPVRKLLTPLFGSNHRLSQDQKNWFKRQDKAGGKGFVYIRSETFCALLPGNIADDINKMTICEIIHNAIWSHKVPVPAEEWKKLREAIINGQAGKV